MNVNLVFVVNVRVIDMLKSSHIIPLPFPKFKK